MVLKALHQSTCEATPEKTKEVLANTMTGVFIGMGANDWNTLQKSASPYSATGSAISIASNRISYVLGLHGPSLTIDTACSSALVALDVATQSLYNKNCDKALVSSACLMLSPSGFVGTCMAKMLSPHGKCFTFSKEANGYVRGEGCGSVVLVRKSELQTSEIWGWIKGVAIVQDGRTSNLTSPNGLSQEMAMNKALNVSGIKATQITYHEAHGTGTSLGDPIEISHVDKHTQRTNKTIVYWCGKNKCWTLRNSDRYSRFDKNNSSKQQQNCSSKHKLYRIKPID